MAFPFALAKSTISSVTVDNSAGDEGALGHNTDAFDVSASDLTITGSTVKNQDDCELKFLLVEIFPFIDISFRCRYQLRVEHHVLQQRVLQWAWSASNYMHLCAYSSRSTRYLHRKHRVWQDGFWGHHQWKHGHEQYVRNENQGKSLTQDASRASWRAYLC